MNETVRKSPSERRKNAFYAVALAAYIALNVFFLLHHENWRDEAQAWLLSRDLSIPELIRQMSYEGHPCLWHLLLMPLAKLGALYISMNVLSLAIMAAAAALFLWKSPVAIAAETASPVWGSIRILLSSDLAQLLSDSIVRFFNGGVLCGPTRKTSALWTGHCPDGANAHHHAGLCGSGLAGVAGRGCLRLPSRPESPRAAFAGRGADAAVIELFVFAFANIERARVLGVQGRYARAFGYISANNAVFASLSRPLGVILAVLFAGGACCC